MNIPIVPLSKSTFTVMFSCVSTFSTSIFNYISLSILNVLLISLCLSFSFTVLFRTPICILLYCAFSCLGHATTLQSHHSYFLSILYSGHRILSLSSFDTSTTISLRLHQVHFTLTASLSFTESSLHLYALKH